MDNLEQRLRDDAARINVEITAELDDRIRASLEGVTPEKRAEPLPRKQPRSMWWASSLTGVAAAAVVILVVNLQGPPAPPDVVETPISADPWLMPVLNAETAVLADPLRQELEDLEADLKKAEQAVRDEFDLSL